MTRTIKVLKNILRAIFISSIIYGMAIAWLPMSKPLTDVFEFTSWEAPFLIIGFAGWAFAAFVGSMLFLVLIGQFITWLFTNSEDNAEGEP